MLKISDFQKDLKREDKITLAKLVHTPLMRGYVYDKEGNAFEVDSKIRPILNKDKTFSVFDYTELYIVPNDNEDGDVYHLKNDNTNKTYPPMAHVAITEEDSDSGYKIVSLEDYTVIPRGKLWEQFLSEIVFVKFLNEEGEIDKDNEYIKEFFDNSGYDEDPDYYGQNAHLVYHPPSCTYAQLYWHEGDHYFSTVVTNQDYDSTNIEVALIPIFEWAVHECSYGQKE